MQRIFPWALGWLIIAWTAPARCNAAPGLDWQNIRDHQPSGLHLKLTLPKSHFFQGEEIPATLVFSNQSRQGYHTWIGTYDRSGRILDIGFHAISAESEPVSDPLGWYFKRSMGLAGGMGNWTNLGEWSAKLPVNEWLRFDRPGTYVLYAWSNRVQTGAYHDSRDTGGNSVNIVSDRVTVTIDPLTPRDEQDIIDHARKVFADQNHDFFSPLFPSQEAIGQLDKLCFLRTPAALDELLPFLSEGNNDAGRRAAYAFLGAPDPKAEAAVLLAGVRQGKALLNQFIVQIYVALKTFPSVAPLGLTLYGPDGRALTSPTDPEQLAQQEIITAAKQASDPEAVASACWADFQNHPNDPAASAALVQHQLDLPANERFQLINQGVSSRDFLPILRKAAGPPEYNPYALGNLAGLAPDEARPLIIADIKRDQSRYLNKPRTHFPTPLGLNALPEKPIPELTETFRRKMQDKNLDPDLLLPLVDRYGTDDLFTDVKRLYLPQLGKWPCDTEAACLRFWIRHDPTGGMKALQASLLSRKETRCYTMLLENVFEDQWSDLAQPFIVSNLKDEDPDFIMSAIKILERRGTVEAIEPAIAALERIDSSVPPKNDDAQPLYIQREQEAELARKLLESPRWTTYTPTQKNSLTRIAVSSK